MWIQVRADKAEFPHRLLEIPQALHAAKRINPRQAGEPGGVLPADVTDALVGQLKAALHIDVAGPNSNQQGAFDPGPVHALKVIGDGYPAPDLRWHAHLGLESLV